MNYLELLDKELKNTDWDLEHKRRYIYLRSCNLFNFDTRLYFVDPTCLKPQEIEAKNAKQIYRELRNKEVDLENVQDKRITCFSWSKAHIKLNKELLGLKASYAESMFGNHAWTMAMGHKADATADSDITRVKMNLDTKGYILSTSNKSHIPDCDGSKKIKIIDQEIFYIGKNYVDLQKIALYFIEKMYLELYNGQLDKENMLNKMMNKIIEIYKSYQGILLDFEDASFCLSYIFKKFCEKCGLKIKGGCVNLFLDDNSDNWDFADLYWLNYQGKDYFYLLSKADIGYEFKEIPKNEAYRYINNFKGDKSLILHNKNPLF